MTRKQSHQVDAMRLSGKGYVTIANVLGISVNTVKSYCRRMKDTVLMTANNSVTDYACGNCGCALKYTPGVKRKRFCSDKCRMAWWKAHPGSVNRKAIYHFTCAFCNNKFESYGNAHRKYCSRACFANARRAVNG